MIYVSDRIYKLGVLELEQSGSGLWPHRRLLFCLVELLLLLLHTLNETTAYNDIMHNLVYQSCLGRLWAVW
jgi:hypothetical protein